MLQVFASTVKNLSVMNADEYNSDLCRAIAAAVTCEKTSADLAHPNAQHSVKKVSRLICAA